MNTIFLNDAEWWKEPLTIQRHYQNIIKTTGLCKTIPTLKINVHLWISSMSILNAQHTHTHTHIHICMIHDISRLHQSHSKTCNAESLKLLVIDALWPICSIGSIQNACEIPSQSKRESMWSSITQYLEIFISYLGGQICHINLLTLSYS